MKGELIIDDGLIVKYLMGEATPDEAVLLEKWIALSEENKTVFDEMEKIYRIAYKKERVNPDKNEAWKKINRKIGASISLRQYVVAAAAVFAGILIFTFIFINSLNTPEVIYANAKERSEILSDKSYVKVSKDSKLELEEGFGKSNRTVKLFGKAEFKVEHEGIHPFIVKADDLTIEDIGTVFAVDNSPMSDTIYVVVKEGIVRLYDENGQELIIKAGEKAWYIKSEKKIIADIATKVVKFDFNQTKLSEVVKLLEESYEVSIELVPAQLGECIITTQFFDEEIATIINIITETNGLRYEYQNHLYKIKGKPCQ